MVSYREDGQEVRTISLDRPTRWDLLTVDVTRGASLRVTCVLVEGAHRRGSMTLETNDRLSLALRSEPAIRWSYRLSGNRLELHRSGGGSSADVILKRATDEFPLTRHSFHLIQERPRTP